VNIDQEWVNRLKQAAEDGVLALVNSGTAPMAIHCTDGTTTVVEPGFGVDVAWGERGRFDKILRSPYPVME
jgi:hypothetical protein